MWLDMAGVTARAIPTDAQLLPDPEATRALITERTRAISLVTPNNPAGVEYPPELVLAFFKLAQETGIKLIVDETYRDFHSQTGAPHGLFQQADWDQTLIHLYSFSKAFRLTGHRVGRIDFIARVARRGREIPRHRRNLPEPDRTVFSTLGIAEPDRVACRGTVGNPSASRSD